MTAILKIKCDGPECKREISSDIHAGTWFTLQEYDIFKPKDNRVQRPDKHFCSHQCLHNYVASLQASYFGVESYCAKFLNP